MDGDGGGEDEGEKSNLISGELENTEAVKVCGLGEAIPCSWKLVTRGAVLRVGEVDVRVR